MKQRNPWKTLLAKAKSAAKPGQEKKNGIKRTEPLDVTITEQYIAQQYKSQDGKCYWSDYPIDPYGVYESQNPFAPSLDRLDESKGYIPGNVVITLRLMNLGRQTCPPNKFKEKIKKLQNHFKGEIVISQLFPS
jgi:hypothetical protein